eukprot:snap_masked-scaffold_143-processed-gene-0.0-mRNA-1 protein AED:0.48 eAED:0.48 QI:0/0/0/0.33/1/1/3/0/307
MHELAQFVYRDNFLCGIIPEFSRIRKLVLGDFKLVGKLKNLERKFLLIEWTSEMEVAFIELKEALKKTLVSSLGYYKQNENIYIFADASDKYWSLYLCQTPDDVEIENPLKARYSVIALNNGSFGGSQLNCHISSKELYPMVLFTDHRNLVGIIEPKEVKTKAYASRLGRWSVDFMSIGLKVFHLDGDKNIPADCLSRWMNPDYIEESEEEKYISRISKILSINSSWDEAKYWKNVDSYHISMRHPVHDAKPPASNWQVMDDLFVFKYQKKDIPSLTEVLKENEKIVLTRSLIPFLIMGQENSNGII